MRGKITHGRWTPLLAVVLFAGFFLISGVPLIARAEFSPCTGASHIATEAEARSVSSGAIVAGQTVVCDSDASLGITPEAGEAKQYLKSLPRTGSATNNTNIEMLNSAFAICSENFFKEFKSKYGPVTILSAYRSPEEEARLCANNPRCGMLMNISAPNGNHQKALAMDVRATQQATMYNFARQNPQFGVCFPFTGEGGGFVDPEHMILAGIPGAETQGPGCRGVVKACAAGHFDPNSIRDVSPMMYATTGTSPSNSFTQFSGMPQQPPYAAQYPMAYQPSVGYQPAGYQPPMAYQPPMGYQSPYQSPMGSSPMGYQSPTVFQSLLSLLLAPQVQRSPLPPPTLYAEISSIAPTLQYANTDPLVPTATGTTQTTSTIPSPSASLIIAQSTKIPKNGATLISWSSVGMAPESCAVTRNNMPFSGGAQGSKVLSSDMTGSAGTIAVALDCRDLSGTNRRKSVGVVVQ